MWSKDNLFDIAVNK